MGFATVPGFVSFTSTEGSPYLQALAGQLREHHATTDLADIHLLVKRELAGGGVCQGAEERSSLLSKLLFSRYRASKEEHSKSPFSFFSLPSTRSSSPMPVSKRKLLGPDRPRPLSAVFTSSSLKQFLPGQKNFPKSSPDLPGSLSRSMSSPTSSFSPRPDLRASHSTHVVEVRSSDVERGLKELLEKVKEVYGGEGKVKVKRKNKTNVYAFKYGGPERGAMLLESAIQNVKELQAKSQLWKFTQRLEVSSMTNLNEIESKN